MGVVEVSLFGTAVFGTAGFGRAGFGTAGFGAPIFRFCDGCAGIEVGLRGGMDKSLILPIRRTQALATNTIQFFE